MRNRSDRPSQSVPGIKHQISPAKEWREWCKRLDKRIAREDALYLEGRSWMRWNELNALVAQRDREWAEAEKLSYYLGHFFKDRHGVMQCVDEPRDLVGLAFCSWCLKKGVTYRL